MLNFLAPVFCGAVVGYVILIIIREYGTMKTEDFEVEAYEDEYEDGEDGKEVQEFVMGHKHFIVNNGEDYTVYPLYDLFSTRVEGFRCATEENAKLLMQKLDSFTPTDPLYRIATRQAN